MSNLRLLAAGLAALAAMAAPRPPSVLADRVFLGGRIWTGDPARPRAQALALAGDVIVAVGTDAEVRPCIGPATTTVNLRGRFVAPGFNDAQERISAEAALRHFTRDAAYASFEEQRKGTLAARRLADLVVLSDDILAIPPAQILKTRVLLTVMAGHDTYRAGDF
ncbi:MAG TPA: amidohydrolase family protein [Vicinamibacteria bacterium]|nr:amidohydrolase family protein [Vicinamibacteria bacterium]